MAHLHGYELSGEPLPSTSSVGDGPLGTITITTSTEEELLAAAGERTVLRSDGAGTAFTLARRAGGFVVWARGCGTFSADPAKLWIETAVGGQEEDWAHHLATVVVPLLLVERGAVALHASGVAAGAGAVLFAGSSGRGKSTASALAAGCGYAPLADDAIVFSRPGSGDLRIFAGGSGLRATPRAAAAAGGWDEPGLADERGSRRIQAGGHPAQPVGAQPVAAIVALAERGPRLRAERLQPARAIPKLVPSLLHVGDRRALRSSFAGLASVLERTPVWLASLPDDLRRTREELPELVELVSATG